ncbi:peptidoglycan DD-metalloendopeptidase family protein [Halobacillus sp. SY10]|uniref:peptidoglycan DD-metalloendopeptidase family protein n=1 Tax=Halobacillus sp. SY10 TaxID=3381356 RepID=UPI00387A53D9
MTLKDLTLGFQADSDPLQQLNRELQKFNQFTGDADKELRQMSKSFERSQRGMVKESVALNRELGRQSDAARQLAKTMGTSATQLADDWSDMSTEMKKSLVQNHNQLRVFRKEVFKSEMDMRKLGMQMGTYAGTTDDFMGEVAKLGKQHKKATDQMINNNMSMRQGFVQTVATMKAMTGQSEKIAKNYDRLDKAFYKVNKPLLKVTGGLERMARQGNASVLALEMLGPNASMKELSDQVRVINQGIMRQQALLVGAGVAWLGFTAILAHSALGPDVAENLQQQEQAIAEYQKELKKRTEEIANTWSIFEDVQMEATKPSDLQKNLQEQVAIMDNWQKNLTTLSTRTDNGYFIQHLRTMGPEAAAEIKALTQMSQTELNKYVGLWEEKMKLSKDAAVTELAALKRAADRKVKDLQDSLTPLGKAWYEFKDTWAVALTPFVEMWGIIAAQVVKAGTKIGEFVQSLNEVSPWITKIAGMFLYLFSTALLFLTPLAVGIGYLKGLKAAFAGTWVIMKGFVTGLGATAGSAALVAASVLAVGVALYFLWTRSETFRNIVTGAWDAIKSKAIEVWGFIKPYILQALGVIVSFGQEKLAQLRSFWESNGQQILLAGKNVFGFLVTVIGGALQGIWAAMKFVWPMVFALIKSVWGNIKGVIDGALNIIMGLVKVFTGLFTGDFSKMWEGVKQIFFGAIQFVWNYINLLFVGRILKAGKVLYTGFKTIVTTLWGAMKSIFMGGVNFVKNFTVKGFQALHKGASGFIDKLKFHVGHQFKTIVDAAKALPGKIGEGIKNMAGKTWSGIKSFGQRLADGFAKIINGATGGVNWIMGKLGIDFAIPEWDPPKYAKGTDFHPGGPAIVGEQGRELIHANGRTFLAEQEQLLNLPRGASVLPNRQTEMALQGVPGYAGGVGDFFKNSLGKLKDVGLDVWNYLSNPSQLVGKVLDSLGISFPSEITGAFGKMGQGAFSLIKDKVIDFVKGKMAETAGPVNFGNLVKTSSFGTRFHPILKKYMLHAGDDYGGALGTAIRSQSGGRVIHSGPAGSFGNLVKVQRGIYTHFYAHLQRAMARVGSMVSRGDVIGTLGSTGRSTGPHLHYEVRKNGVPIPPGGGFATGGIATHPQIASLAENGWKEFIIPTQPSMRGNALRLLDQANQEIGYKPKESRYNPSMDNNHTSGGYKGQQIVFSPEFVVHVDANAKVDQDTLDMLERKFKQMSEEQFESLLRRMGFNREG